MLHLPPTILSARNEKQPVDAAERAFQRLRSLVIGDASLDTPRAKSGRRLFVLVGSLGLLLIAGLSLGFRVPSA
jgi:hypothetical protein